MTGMKLSGPGTAMALAAGPAGLASGIQTSEAMALMMFILALLMVVATCWMEWRHVKKFAITYHPFPVNWTTYYLY